MSKFEGGKIGLVWDSEMGGEQRPLRGYHHGTVGDHLASTQPLFCATGSDDPGDARGGQVSQPERGSVMARLGILWSILSGRDAALLRQHERRISALEARETFRRMAKDMQR